MASSVDDHCPDFSNDCARLPAVAPADHAHLIDMDTYDLGELEMNSHQTYYNIYDVKLWDAVCTMLFKISPTVLDQFLDSQTFQLVLEFDCVGKPKIIVWRQGRQVLVGMYIQYVDRDLIKFDALVRAEISYDGSWKLTSATWGKYTKSNLDHVWNEVYLRVLNNPRDCMLPTEEGRKEHARKLGVEILHPVTWDPEDGSTWVVKVI